MRNMSYRLKTIGFILLLGLCCLSGLWGQQFSEVFTIAGIPNYQKSWNPLMEPILLGTSSSNGKLSLSYRAILATSELTWNPLLNTEPIYETETDELSRLLQDQMQDLMTLRTQWTTLQTLSRELREDNRELMLLLQDSGRTIEDLLIRLEAAMERVTDAEDGAIALLDENTELFNQARLAMANIAHLQQQLARARRGAVIGFSVGGVTLGVGTPLIVTGIIQDNSTMLWSGVGTVGVGSFVWATGHFVFGWW